LRSLLHHPGFHNLHGGTLLFCIFWHSPTRLYTDKHYNSHANQITQTYYHIGVKLGVHASQHYNSQVNQIAQTYYHIGVKLEVHASHRYSRIVQGTGYAYMEGN